MDLTSLISLESAILAGIAGIIGILIGWIFTKLAYLKKLGRMDVKCQADIATLTETVRAKTQEALDHKSELEDAHTDLSQANERILHLSEQVSAAQSKLDQMASLTQELDQSRNEIKQLLSEISNLKQQTATLQTQAAAEQKASEEKMNLLKDMKANLEETVQSLSSNALEKNNRVFLDLANSAFSKYLESAKTDFDLRSKTIKDVVAPVKDALNKYDEQIRAVEREREKAYGGLSQQVISLTETQSELQKETSKLVRAMRVPHVRGRWGELTLRRVAELSGMEKQCDFFEQPTTDTGEGLLRPDMMVCLPGERRIIVDAKVPLTAYLDALESESDDQREKRLTAHARHVHDHIRKLSQKAYWSQFDPSPEFVIMFIPGENFFSAALSQNHDLIEFGAKNGVILATPTTLITLLKTISFAWRQETMAENAKAISLLGKDLYERLNTMAKHVNRLGRDIDRCAQTYNQVLGSFERRVFSAARRFNEFGITLKEDKDLLTIEPVETKTRELPEPEDA